MARIASHNLTTPDDIAVNIASFERHLRAANLSPTTIKTYTEGARLLARFLANKGMPGAVAGIRREHVEAFTTRQLEFWKPATAMNRYRACQSFFNGSSMKAKSKNLRWPR